VTHADPTPRAGVGDPADAAVEHARLTRAAGSVALATVVSRLLGFLRDAVIAWGFGTGFGSDAFLAAFRIPNLFRRLLGEGSLSSAFVPVLAETLSKGGRRAAQDVAAAAARILAIALTAACLVGLLAAPGIVLLVAPGFTGAKFELTVSLTRLMLPYLVAAGMAALWMGTLNVFGSFAAPAMAPALLNIAMIAGMLGLAPLAVRPEEALAVAVLVGGAAQLAFLSVCSARHGVRIRRAACEAAPVLKRAARLLLPIGLASAVHQINVLAGGLLASFLPEGSVSCLYYAERLVEFPLGVIAIAAATAVLPSLAREAALGDQQGLAATLTYAFRMVSFVTLPAMAGLLLLAEPMVSLLFQRGEFGDESVRLTSQAVSYYALGLWGVSAARITATLFFATQDARAPLRAALASIAANLVFGVVLMRPMAAGGLSLAAALAALVNLGFLLAAVRRKLGRLDWRALGLSLGRSLGCTLFMAAGVWQVSRLAWVRQLHEAIGLTVSIAAGVLIYAAAARAVSSPELASVRRLLKGDRFER
jgi:putative peptidoglycan lipid II flippase